MAGSGVNGTVLAGHARLEEQIGSADSAAVVAAAAASNHGHA
jgi:hypothetical protein